MMFLEDQLIHSSFLESDKLFSAMFAKLERTASRPDSFTFDHARLDVLKTFGWPHTLIFSTLCQPHLVHFDF